MKCICPISIKTKEGRQHVPCGTCIACLTKKQQDWNFRLHQELKKSTSNSFICLTYNEHNVPIMETANKETGEIKYSLNLSKRDLQLFMKKLRKNHSKKLEQFHRMKQTSYTSSEKDKIRYYAIGEYGTQTKRPHYHILLFNCNPQTTSEIQEIWGKGTIDVGHVEPKSITYVSNYIINSRNQYYGERQKPFSTMSKQPGIGNNYLSNTKWHKDNKYFHVINHSGTKISIPDYYKNKIFTKRQIEDHKLKNEQPLINKEIAEEKRLIKLGNNPYTTRQNRIEAKIRKYNKSTKKEKL